MCGRGIIFAGLLRAGSAFAGAHAVGVGKGGGSSCTQAQMHTVQDVFIQLTYIYGVPTTCLALFQVLWLKLYKRNPLPSGAQCQWNAAVTGAVMLTQ